MSLQPLAAILVLLFAGCGGGPTRRVETHLGENARIYFDGSHLQRDETGAIAVPLGPERHAVRIEEPRKSAITADVRVLVDPPAELEDRLVYSSFANTTIVHTGERGGSMAGAPRSGPVSFVPDPLSLLLESDGPFFGPSGGEGAVVVATPSGARAVVDRRETPLPGEAKIAYIEGVKTPFTSPAVLPLAPGAHTLRVERPGYQSFAGNLEVKAGEYAYVAVRLAEDRSAAATSTSTNTPTAVPASATGTADPEAGSQQPAASSRKPETGRTEGEE